MYKKAQIDRRLKTGTRLHYTWYLGVILITIIVVNQFPVLYELWQRILLGLATSIMFFLIIGIRQNILNYIASRKHIPFSSVILYAFGGVPQVSRKDYLPVLEVFMGVTGILSMLIATILLYLVHILLVISGSELMAGLIQWLAFIVLMLTFLDILPAYPLDGGRILNAAIWKKTGDYYRSIQIVSWIGWVAGLALIIAGYVVLALNHQLFTGLIIIFGGFSLERAAYQQRSYASLRSYIKDVSIADILSKEYPVVSPDLKIGELIRNYVSRNAQSYYMVLEGTELSGIITLHDITSLPHRKRGRTTVSKIMTPAVKIETASPEQPGDILLEQMEKTGIEQMPVMEEKTLIGVVTRNDLLRVSRSRMRLRL